VAAIIVASSPATLASSTSSKALTTAWAIRLGFGFINLQSPATEFAPIQRSDGFLCFARVRHLNKGKTSRAAGVAVGYDANLIHLTMGFEKASQLGLAGAVGQVANVKVLHCCFSGSI
jgi:hypothetical protein